MARSVFANNRNFSHKGSGDKSLSSAPDVCKTPMGSATPPMPYPVMSQAADAEGYTTSVFIDGHPTAIASSTHKTCTGDEPGSAKGLISGTTGDKTEFMSYSFDVRCEGEGVVRHQDLTMMNSGNTLGSVFGASTTPETIEDAVDEDEGIFIDFYITDYEEELRIDETIPGEKIWLNVRTRNLIGKMVTINLDDGHVDFKYNGDVLINDTLTDYLIQKDLEKILLEVVPQTTPEPASESTPEPISEKPTDTQEKETAVAFVGGAGDKNFGHIVETVYNITSLKNKTYFTWHQKGKLIKWIKDNAGKKLIVIGHSYGGDTAAHVVCKGNYVDHLVTVDPVGWTRPNFDKVKTHSGLWENYNATGDSPFQSANMIAGIGGAWNEAPKDHCDYYEVPINHAAIFIKVCEEKQIIPPKLIKI